MSRISSFRTYFHAHIWNSLRSSAPPSIKAKPKPKAAVLGVRPFGIIPTNVLAGQRLGVELALLEVALWNSLLSDTSFREEVLLSEELFGKRSPIKSIYVLRDLATACTKQPPCVEWVFDALMDAAYQDFEEGLRHCLLRCHRQVGRQDLEKLLSRQLGLGS